MKHQGHTVEALRAATGNGMISSETGKSLPSDHQQHTPEETRVAQIYQKPWQLQIAG
jgi:hypothetical protein